MSTPLVEYIKENSIAAGLIGLIVGVAVGLALPESDSEASLIEQLRDRAEKRTLPYSYDEAGA